MKAKLEFQGKTYYRNVYVSASGDINGKTILVNTAYIKGQMRVEGEEPGNFRIPKTTFLVTFTESAESPFHNLNIPFGFEETSGDQGEVTILLSDKKAFVEFAQNSDQIVSTLEK